MRLSHGGITVDLPRGWEGAVNRQREPSPAGRRAFGHAPERPVHTPASLHLANFPLPAVRGDFGSGAVDRMRPGDVLVALVEYGPECVDTALFEPSPWPVRLRADEFRARGLQRTLPGQAGAQRFLTVAGRAFSLYVVLAGRDQRRSSVLAAQRVLDALRIGPRS